MGILDHPILREEHGRFCIDVHRNENPTGNAPLDTPAYRAEVWLGNTCILIANGYDQDEAIWIAKSACNRLRVDGTAVSVPCKACGTEHPVLEANCEECGCVLFPEAAPYDDGSV